MICLRCGYCCQKFCVVIVDDPKKGITPENLKPIGFRKSPERCQHLTGDRPGEYSCAIHHYPWYKETPCYSHGQIERSPTDECRMGRYILNKEGNVVKAAVLSDETITKVFP